MKAKILMIISFTVIFNMVYSQSENDKLDNQVLIIYNEYTPVLKDANRIQYLPVVIDTVKIVPKFEYNVNPTMYKTEFNPVPISVATVKGRSLRPLDNGMIKLGFGNYMTPYVEAFYNSRRQKNYSAGAYLKHLSSHGKTKNTEGQKIYNGYADNIIKGYGKLFLPSSTLYGDLGFTSNIINYYGYDPVKALELNTAAPRDRSEMESMNYMRFMVQGGILSNNISRYKFDYKANIGYQYFFTSEKDKQHKLKIDADLNKAFRSNRFGLDAKFELNNNKIDTLDKYNRMFLDLNPYYKLYSNNWQIRVGLNTTGEFGGDSVKYHFYPNLYVQHNIGNTLIPYASFSGYLVNNDMEHISKENPFINRFNNYQVTNYAQVIDIGIKGNISRNLFFHIKGNYSKIDNMAYFVNDTVLALENKFLMEYANTERFSGYAELALRNFHNFTFSLNGHYYYYSYVKEQEKPWHMPSFDARLKADYQFNDRLNFGLIFDLIGSRYAKEYVYENAETVINAKKLKAIVDVSLYGEYTFSSNFSCFLNLNNITGQKQYYWNNYQSLGFNVMAGLKYLF